MEHFGHLSGLITIALESWPALVPVSRLLILVCYVDQSLLAPCRADELDSGGKIICAEPIGNGDSGHANQITCSDGRGRADIRLCLIESLTERIRDRCPRRRNEKPVF